MIRDRGMPAATHGTIRIRTADSSTSRLKTARGPALVVVAMAVLALALRFVGIGGLNLWLDESSSWFVARYPLPTLAGYLQEIPGAAAHLPLFFLLLKGWMAVFGDSEAALRAFSVAASVALLGVTYAIGARLLTRRAALLGTLPRGGLAPAALLRAGGADVHADGAARPPHVEAARQIRVRPCANRPSSSGRPASTPRRGTRTRWRA